jgi:hypothetical protein
MMAHRKEGYDSRAESMAFLDTFHFSPIICEWVSFYESIYDSGTKS